MQLGEHHQAVDSLTHVLPGLQHTKGVRTAIIELEYYYNELCSLYQRKLNMGDGYSAVQEYHQSCYANFPFNFCNRSQNPSKLNKP